MNTASLCYRLDGMRVSSALALLRREARRMTLDEHARHSGVPAARIAALAERYTSHDKQAVAGGPQASGLRPTL